MYKALEVEFINEFTKTETHKISLKKTNSIWKITHSRARIYEKKILCGIGKNDILENHPPKCG